MAKLGRPTHKPTNEQRKLVRAMASVGVPEKDISTVLEIDPKTLRKHYRTELDAAHIEANTKVAQSLFEKATGDGPASVTAAIWWTKARMGWKETSVNEHGGVAGGPLIVELVRFGEDTSAKN